MVKNLWPDIGIYTYYYYFLKKVQSNTFGMALNTPLSHKPSICYYNPDDNRVQVISTPKWIA